MQKTKKDFKCVRENLCQSEEGAVALCGQLCVASGSGRGEVCGSREKFSGGEEGAQRGMRLLRARGSAELGLVASGSATQGL